MHNNFLLSQVKSFRVDEEKVEEEKNVFTTTRKSLKTHLLPFKVDLFISLFPLYHESSRSPQKKNPIHSIDEI